MDPCRHFVIALAFSGFMSLLPRSGTGSSPVMASASAYDPLSDLWRIDLRTAPAAPAESRVATSIPAASPRQESEIQPGCEWDFTPNTSPHAELFGEHIWPDVAIAPDGSTALAWMDDHEGGTYHIFYSTSTDGGATWSAPEPVDERTTGETSRFVSLDFTDSGIPVAVWEDDRTGALNVYLSKRDPENGGMPWTPPVQINTAGSPPFDYPMNPSLAILDDLRFFVAWTDWREGVLNQVYMRSTTDGGNTWGQETRISDGLGYRPVASDPCLIVDPSSGPMPGTEILNCVTNDWRGDVPSGRYPNVFFYRSIDGGAHWTIGVQVNDIEPLYQQVSAHSLVRLDDGTLTGAWFHFAGNPPQFHTAVSTDLGQTWAPSTRVDPSGIASGVSISAMADWVFAGFSISEGGNLNAYVRASSDGGRTWIEPVCRMDDAPSGDANSPIVVAFSPNEIQAVWRDNRPGFASWKILTTRGSRASAGVASPGEASGGAPRLGSLVGVPNPSSCAAPVRIAVRGAASSVQELSGKGSRQDADLLYGVYDCAGRRLRILPEAARGAVWDGADASGRPAPPGVYWVRIEPGASGTAGAYDAARGAARIVRLR